MNDTSDITYIGVDIAKLKFDICINNGDFSDCVYNSYDNNISGFFDFLSLLESVNHLKDIRIGLEATSTYMVNLQKYLDKNKIKYILINPSKLHHYIKYKHTESKTDKLDSYYISEFITTLKDTSFNSKHSTAKAIYQSYNAYLNLIITTETRLKGLNDSILNDDFTSDTLKKEIMGLKEALTKTKNIAQRDFLEIIKIAMPEYDLIKNDLIGVGDKTLLSVLPVIYDISNKYSSKQLQSLVGLNPVYKSSGSSINKKQRISKQGNSQIRKMLYMSSISSIQNNTELSIKYQRLIDNGKPPKVALVAIMCHIFRAIVSKLNYYKALSND